MTRALACLAIAACSAPASSTLPASTAPPELTWTMTLEKDRVRIDYTVENRTNQRIVLLDQLREMKGRASFAVVRTSDQPKTVAFTLGYVPPDPSSKVDLRPMARVVEPHAKAAGIAYAKWPLRAQHNTSQPSRELPLGLEGVQLEIGYIDGASTLETVTIDRETFSVPDAASLRAQKLLRSQVRELPFPNAPIVEDYPLEIRWGMTHEGARLRIDYTVRNKLQVPILLCDRLRTMKAASDLAIVEPSFADGGVVKFVLAYIPPVRTIVEKRVRPIARVLAPNESATGVAYVELPIRPYHPLYEPPYVMPPRFDYATFVVGFVEDITLETETTKNQTFEVPTWKALQAERLDAGDIQRIP